jgi:hypothetical protein
MQFAVLHEHNFPLLLLLTNSRFGYSLLMDDIIELLIKVLHGEPPEGVLQNFKLLTEVYVA